MDICHFTPFERFLIGGPAGSGPGDGIPGQADHAPLLEAGASGRRLGETLAVTRHISGWLDELSTIKAMKGSAFLFRLETKCDPQVFSPDATKGGRGEVCYLKQYPAEDEIRSDQVGERFILEYAV